jgi:hypothetical protein
VATFFSGYFALKVLLTALVVVGVAALARQYSLLAAILASLPLTSILAFVWMHVEGQDNATIAALSGQILWLVLPSLAFFAVFPLLLRLDWAFVPALLGAALVTAGAYGLMLKILAVLSKAA